MKRRSKHNDESERKTSVRSWSHDFHSRTFLAIDFMTAAGGFSLSFPLKKLMIDQLSNKSQFS